jgi:hypothetical protein
MPINKENTIQLGFSATLEINDTIEDFCERFGFSKSYFIRQAVKEKIYHLLYEKKVLS